MLQLRDFTQAVRALSGRPGLTATTVLTLAIGVGGVSALFSVASSLLLRPLPVPEASRLVRLFGASDVQALGITSYANLRDVADRAHSFTALTIHQQTYAAFGLGDDTTNNAVELVSGNYFQTFKVEVALGRPITRDDDRAGADRVVVVSDRFWRGRLGGDRTALGRTIHLNGSPFTVVGIAPAAFHGSYDALATEMWAPLMTYDVVRPRGLDIHRRTWGWLQATARLAPGVSIQQAAAEVATLVAALRAEYPRENASLAMAVVPASSLPESMTPGLSRALLFAIVIAALALLAACANVANAMLAAVSDRGAEIAVRMALGASRADIARQWLTESLVASLAATALGLLLAVWVRDGLFALRPLSGYDNFAPTPDIGWRVWAFATLLMAVAAGISGVMPALRAAHVDPAQPLRDGAVTNVGGARGHRLRSVLLSTQAAVALALMAVAGLLGQSVRGLQRVDLGFDSRGLVLATASVSALGHDDLQSHAFHVDAMTRMRALPGAAAVTAAATVPLGDNDERRGVIIDGYTPPDGSGSVSTATNVVWPGYFEVMGIPLMTGRAFTDADGRQGAPLVAVVNQTMARTYWPSQDAVGRTIRLGGRPATVVGVVRDSVYYAVGEAPLPFLFLPYGPAQLFQDGLTFHVRTAIDPSVMARQMTGVLRSHDPRVRVVDAMAYDDLRAAALFPARALGWLSVGFALPALALFVVGTYGVTAYVVAGRRRELALRMALGASWSSLQADVIRRAVQWAVPGALVGVGLAMAMGQLLRSSLAGVAALEPASLGFAAFALLVTLAGAAWMPVRRVGTSDLAGELRK